MQCATHPDREATAFCRTCGKPLCPECTRDVRGILYCEACLAAMVAAVPPAAPSATPTGVPSPGVAAALGFIPGLGAIYNGEYVKGLVHIAIFAGIIAILNAQPSDAVQAFFGVGLACFIFYMPIEAYRTAKMKQAAAYAAYARHPGATPVAPGEDARPAEPVVGPTAAPFAAAPGAPTPVPQVQPGPFHSSISGAVILIALGVLILLANLGLLSGEWFSHWWPVILIGLGLWLLWKRFHQPEGKGGQQP